MARCAKGSSAEFRLKTLRTPMPRPYQTKIWRLQIPDGWSVRDTPGQELVTFYRPDGVGLLQVLTSEERSPVPTSAGEEFHGQLPGRTRTRTYGEKFRRLWAFSCHGQRV